MTSKDSTSSSVIAHPDTAATGENVHIAPLLPVPAGLHLAQLGGEPSGTVLGDPPWRFTNRTGKVAPEHRRLSRYETMATTEIAALPVAGLMAAKSHCYLWVPNALVAEGLVVMGSWGFTYKSLLLWHKIRKDGGSDGRGVGFYFRNVTELVVFGVRGGLRTLPAGRRQVNLFATRKREHSRKPDELYDIVEDCSPGAYPRVARPPSARRMARLGRRGRLRVIAADSSVGAIGSR